MGLVDFIKKQENLIAIDIGFSCVRLLELDFSTAKPSLVNLAVRPFSENVFSNNVITKPEKVAELLGEIWESNALKDRRVVTAVPGPSVFTKKIKMAKGSPAELRENLQFEAGNFIPHNIDAVSLDYHVIGETAQRNELDVLVVAVKNEIIDSFLDSISGAGLETAIVDVDFFALQNMFEMARPDLLEKTVAVINIGARYACINVCRQGQSLFTGDISVGGKQLTDNLVSGLAVTFSEAEKIKKGQQKPADVDGCKAIIDQNIEFMATEINRQLSFFWNASGAEEGIDQILLAGGGSLLKGFAGELGERTGIEVSMLDPLSALEVGSGFDSAYLQEIGPLMSIAVGLGCRRVGDKLLPDLD